ncbi:hypothetical protein OPQ81_011283 [Rhizoctonia solani]|nr:hypothetical protein OPQ81_011283 [Rhizoctonia solani]
MQNISDGMLSLAVKRWEDARDLLASTLTSYLNSCISMEAVSYPGYGLASSKDVASRIESTLDSLQRDMARQLSQSASTLAQTRNRLVSSIWRLPENVLSEIFLHVVYAPEHKCLAMEKCVQAMYSNLHNLMGVCSIWRTIALTQGVFWETIPACDQRTKYLAIELSLQRSGERGLRLATILPKTLGSAPSQLVKIVKDHTNRLRALNMNGEYLGTISDMLKHLLEDGVPSQLSELSIRFAPNNFFPSEQTTPFVIHSKSRNQATFISLMASLSALRLSGVQIQWENMIFSDRLVELSVHGVKLGDSDSAISTFLSAISSAIELRDLKVMDVRADHNYEETTSLAIFPKVMLPKLQSLLLHDLRFNVLQFLLHIITPSSYHVTLGLTGNAVKVVYPSHMYDIIGIDDLTKLLKRFKVDKLLVHKGLSLSNPWLDGCGFRKLLHSIPGVKELDMSGWTFDADFCNSVCKGSISNIERGASVFSKLEVLELTQAWIPDEAAFKTFMANVSTQKMVLGGFIGQEENYQELKKGEGLVTWLADRVPKLYLVDPVGYLPVWMRAEEWRLW